MCRSIRESPDGKYELVMVRLELIPRWVKEQKTEYSTINVATKLVFCDAPRHRRCLSPADESQGKGFSRDWYDVNPFLFPYASQAKRCNPLMATSGKKTRR